MPKSIRRNGINGKNGKDAPICQSMALDVRTVSWKHAWVAFLVPGWTVNTDFSTENFWDPECSDQFVSTSEIFGLPNAPKVLNVTDAIKNYKHFLMKQKSNLKSISTIYKSIEAIELV